eukprot:jgi/Orpsp1_1/1176420/evm.model.c7180000057518.1
MLVKCHMKPLNVKKSCMNLFVPKKSMLMIFSLHGKVPGIDNRFVDSVFGNIEEISQVNSDFYEGLRKIQKRKPVLESMDVILNMEKVSHPQNRYCKYRKIKIPN